jgi:hypothetical protein
MMRRRVAQEHGGISGKCRQAKFGEIGEMARSFRVLSGEGVTQKERFPEDLDNA